MPSKPKKPSKNIEEYNKQRRRVQQFVRRAEQRGFTFPENVIPDRPNKITSQSVERLRKLTPDVLYGKAKYGGISGTERRKQERREAAIRSTATRQRERRAFQQEMRRFEESQIPSIVDVVLSNVEDMINHWTPDPRWSAQLAHYKEQDKNLLASTLRGQISLWGRETVARNLENINNKINGIVADVVQGILYGSGDKYARGGPAAIQANIKLFVEMCQGKPMTVDEAKQHSDEQDAEQNMEEPPDE